MYFSKKQETAAAKFTTGSASSCFVVLGKLSQHSFPPLLNLTKLRTAKSCLKALGLLLEVNLHWMRAVSSRDACRALCLSWSRSFSALEHRDGESGLTTGGPALANLRSNPVPGVRAAGRQSGGASPRPWLSATRLYSRDDSPLAPVFMAPGPTVCFRVACVFTVLFGA